MPRLLTTLGTVINWGPTIKGITAEDANLTRCLVAATAWLERATRRNLVTGTFTAWHSGDRAARFEDTLYLADPASRYALLPVTAVSSITEDGTALGIILATDAGPFADGEHALVSLAQGTVQRVSVSSGKISIKAWASGTMNIRVACTAGYTVRTDSAEGNVPAQLEQAVCEITRQFYLEGSRTGAESYQAEGVDARFVRLLSPLTKQAIDQFRLVRNPVTVES